MKSVLTFVLALFMTAVTMSAQQTVVQNKDLDAFTSVKMDDKFSFRLKNSPTYSVRIIADERIADYVRPVVKGGTLSMVLDEKKYPDELKKALKAKGAAEPVLEIEIYAPTIKKLELKNKAILMDAERLKVDNFELNVSGSAFVNRLHVDCGSATFDFNNSCQANVSISVDSKLTITTSNSSKVNVSQRGGNGFFTTKGSSTLNVTGEYLVVETDASGSSETFLSGKASILKVEASGTSMTDAEALEVKEGDFELSGPSKCHVNVEEYMKVNLTGGTMLTFKRKPVIEVDRIVNSTLIKADDPKRK